MATNPLMQETVEIAAHAVADEIINSGPNKFTPDQIVEFFYKVAGALIERIEREP